MSESDVPIEILTRLRPVCLRLPEVYEEPAWVGVRWRVRKKTFAHVLPVEADWPAAYAKAAATDEPVIVMTFRAQGPELDAIGNAGHPFFYAGWGRDVVGIVFDDNTDWDEVAELVTESYCVLAPQKLIALVDRPPDA